MRSEAKEMKWWRRKKKENPYHPDADPLTLAVNRAFNTGEMVVWREGDPLPDPEGPVKPIEEEGR